MAPSPISCTSQLPSAVVPPPASLLLLPSAVVPLLLFRCGVSIEDAAAACCCVLLWLPRFAASSSPVGCRKKNWIQKASAWLDYVVTRGWGWGWSDPTAKVYAYHQSRLQEISWQDFWRSHAPRGASRIQGGLVPSKRPFD